MHPLDDALLASLTRDLRDLALPARASDPGAADALALLAARGEAWRRLGRPDAAHADLDHARDALVRWEPLPDGLAAAARAVHVARATLLAAEGDAAGAREALRNALAGSAHPEAWLDRFVVDPGTREIALALGADPPPEPR